MITLNTPNFFFGHFVPLGILFLWAFCPFRNNVFWAFYPLGHFVVLGQNDLWAFCLWAFCHTWAFCHFGHFIIESVQDLHLHFHCIKVQQHNRCCRLSTCRICVWHAYSKLRRQKQENIIMELQLYITLFEAVFMKVLHEWLVITD